jgi:3-dehydroquinate dehydratase-1
MNYEDCLDRASREAFVEFRFDLLDLTPAQVDEVISTARKSIATYRPDSGDPDRQIQTMLTAINAGADYIDIELEADTSYRKNLIKEAKKRGREVIISYHNFDHTPAGSMLKEIVESCSRAGADVVKIACLVKSKQDVQTLLGAYREDLRMVVIGMGKMGLITRVAAPFLGAEFTFASPGDGQETAPGQIDKPKLSELISQISRAIPNR